MSTQTPQSRLVGYEVPEPQSLQSCIEFEVQSQSSRPELAGPIQIRAEPGRLGVRWLGEKVWTWLEWHDLTILGRDWSETAREILAEKYETAYEEGLADGLKESFDKKVEEAAELRVVRHSKLRQMVVPDDAG